MNDILIGLAGIAGTLVLYLAALKTHKRFNNPLTSPVIFATFFLVIILLCFHIPYGTYMIGGDWINKLLSPAVVALAYPLYKERAMLKKVAVPILGGTIVGAFIGVTTGVLLVKWAGFDKLIIYSLASKNVTTPVSMEIAGSIGGAKPLAAVFVMIAGLGGMMVGSTVFKCFRITHYLGRGAGFGSASHAVGTAEAMEEGQKEGSVSTIAMVICAVIVSVITPGLIKLWM